jgi:hypothetical protein
VTKRPAVVLMHCTTCLDVRRLHPGRATKCMCSRASGTVTVENVPRINGTAVAISLDRAAFKRAVVDKRGAGMWWFVRPERVELRGRKMGS